MKRRLPVAPPEVLPPLYARWMAECLRAPLPRETEATCDDCAMLPPETGADAGSYYFEVSTRCCTYQPVLPSFLVGRILAGPLEHGRRTVEARIDARLGVLPTGLKRPPRDEALYSRIGDLGFGRTPSMRCPHLTDDAKCGIWLHRNAICATWYCKHVRGQKAMRFWREGVERLLGAVERTLTLHCMVELELDPDAASVGSDSERGAGGVLLDRVDEDEYRERWGAYAGRERQYYARAAEIVAALGWDDVLRISGPDVHLLARATQRLYRELRATALPERLRMGAFQVVAAGAGNLRVSTYSANDALDVPATIVAALPTFDGRRVHEVRAALAKEGLDLEESLIRTLVDFEILVDASA